MTKSGTFSVLWEKAKIMDLQKIILRSIYGKLTEAEEAALQEWLREEHHRKWYERVRRNLTERDAVEFLAMTDTEAALRRVKRRLMRPVRRLAWTVGSAAAAVVVAVALWRVEPEIQPVVVVEQPAGTPTITLASGEVLHLGEEDVDYASAVARIRVTGDEICVSGEEQVGAVQDTAWRYNTLDVPRGKSYSITLADGTRVWVNALSQLRFPSSFEGVAKRRVELTGEGYFEVAKDAAHPFEVVTAQQTIVVTGTSFNVAAYAGETNRTTLCSGSVRVETAAGRGIALVPGQQLATDEAGRMEVTEVDTQLYTAWLEGVYYFDEKTLTEVFRELGKWFDIQDVTYIDPTLENVLFSGKLKKSDGLELILKVIAQGSGSRITDNSGHLKIEKE